jgi:hypothetical protein
MASLMPGYGFDSSGFTTFVRVGHNEIENQRKFGKTDNLILDLLKHQAEGCACEVPLVKSEDVKLVVDYSKLVFKRADVQAASIDVDALIKGLL